MMDGSLGEDGKTPMDDYNADVTKRVVDIAHACGVSVEVKLAVSVHSKQVRRKKMALVLRAS